MVPIYLDLAVLCTLIRVADVVEMIGIFLRHPALLPRTAQVGREDALQIHRPDDQGRRTILLGTILPIRQHERKY